MKGINSERLLNKSEPMIAFQARVKIHYSIRLHDGSKQFRWHLDSRIFMYDFIENAPSSILRQANIARATFAPSSI
jgi:hypothetical protein